MSLDIYLEKTETVEVTKYDANITHNLSGMASEAGIYECVWRSEENGYQFAAQIVPTLSQGIELMRLRPDHFKRWDDENGWGTYDQFLPWLERLLQACKENPDAKLKTSR